MKVRKAQKPLVRSLALIVLAAVIVWQVNGAAVRGLLRRGADPDSCEQPSSFREKVEADYRGIRLLEHLSSTLGVSKFDSWSI